MPAPNIAAITAYTSRGKTDCYWVVAIANRAAPTRAELNAGISLKNILMDQSGWTVTSEQLDKPSLGNRYTPQIPGPITAEESSLTLYMDQEGDDARQLMPDDTSGHIVWLYGGDVAGNKMSVFPVTVSSQAPQISVDGSAPDTMVFSYSITDVPNRNLTIPA